jgi:CBS domain containing-hemolysin-like protein
MTPVVLAAAAEGHHAVSIPGLLLGVLLLVANGFFVAAEIALLAARRARVEERAEAGDPRAAIALHALQELSITFSGAQLGITMCSLGLGAVAEPAVAGVVESLLSALGVPASVGPGVGFAIALSIVVFLHMVVGEMAPKNLALARAEDVALRLARTFRAFVWVFRPLIVLLNGSANLLVRAVRVEPVDEHNLVHTPQELVLALRESQREGTVAAQDARVMSAALQLADIDAEAAMTPRVDLHAVGDDVPVTEVLERAAATGHTRFPVYHGDPDDVVGILHVKDVLIREPEDRERLVVADLLRPVAAVPETRDLPHVLADMRSDRSHAVLVVDEYGATAGLVTLEDVLEELVGELEDEFDPAAVRRRRSRDGWIVDGLLRRDELERLTGLRLPAEQTETVNGWLTEQLGRLVGRGDRVEHEGWALRVLSLTGRRAGRVQVTPPPRPEPSDEDAGDRSDAETA